jgi:hypothetical protein
MKKGLVLISLFILPIVVYLFFATGVNNFITLPVLKEQIPDFNTIAISDYTADQEPTLEGKITILGFLGNDLLKNKGNFFNFNQKIYNKYKEFLDFQVVFLVPKYKIEDVAQLQTELFQIADFSKYVFIYTDEQEILRYYNTLSLDEPLGKDFGTPNVFIIDKNRNLRGRKGQNKKGVDEYKEGYNTASAAELHNEMGDDFKVLIYEYRNAYKRNNPKNQPEVSKTN